MEKVTIYAVAWSDEFSVNVQQYTSKNEADERAGSLKRSGYLVARDEITIHFDDYRAGVE